MSKTGTKAIFVWSGLVQSDELTIRFNPPAPANLVPSGEEDFPWGGYASGAAISTKLLQTTMGLMGFRRFVEIDYPADGLPANCHERHMTDYHPFPLFPFV